MAKHFTSKDETDVINLNYNKNSKALAEEPQRLRGICYLEEHLDGYVGNTIPEKLQKEIEDHLKTCKPCSQEVRERAAFKILLTGRPKFGSEGPHPTPRDLESLCYNRIRKEKEPEILNHLVNCNQCYDIFTLIRTKARKGTEYTNFTAKNHTKQESSLSTYAKRRKS